MRQVLLSIFLSMTWLVTSGQGTVSSSPTLTANNGQAGITFQFSATSPVNITGISADLDPGFTGIDVWMRVGGVSASGSPSITTAAGWTKVVSNATAPGAVTGSLTAITIATPIAVPSGTPVGFHINTLGGSQMNYRTGQATDQVIFSDGTATLNVSDSVSYGGGPPSPTFNPRRFIGSVTYALGVTGGCTPFTSFMIDSISATSAKVDWTPGAGNTGFKLEYGTTGFTPGTGTTVTGTYPAATQPPVVLTGLSANTGYDVYIEEYCTGDTVKFPTPQAFTTTKLCGAPTGFASANLTSNSVDLSWSQAGSFDESWILYGPAGTAAGGTGWGQDTVASPATTYTLSGLSPSTAYDIYLVTNCGAVNGISDTVGPISITTPLQGPQGLNCTVGSPGPVFSDDFESTTGWTGNFGTGTTATNWNYRTGGTGSGGTGPSGAHSGATYIYTETSGTPTGANIEAISPAIDLSTSFNSAELSFWLHAYGAGIDTVQVQVGNSANGPWTSVFTNVGQIQTANTDPWTNVGVNLDSYVGQTIHLRFLVIHGGGFQGDVGIDLVEVNSCQTCPNPGNPGLTFISNDSAAFSWFGAGNAYNINWGPRGFTQGSPSSNFDSTTTNVLNLGGLMGATAYDLYIRNDCSDSANGFSGWVGPYTFITECDPFVAPYSNNFDNDSLFEAPICWENYIAGGTSTTAPVAQVEAGGFNPAYSNPNYVRFYNFNADTTWLISPQFSDLDSGNRRISFFGRTNSTFGSQWVKIGTVASPSDLASYAVVDSFLMTTTWTQYNLDMTTINGYNGTHEYILFEHAADGSFRTIYLDDFVYEIIPPCVPPLVSSLNVNYVTATTAEVSWASGSDGDTTYVEWGAPGFTPGSGLGRIGVSGSVDSVLITGLSAETDYEFYVQDSCSATGSSPSVGPIAFKTSCLITTPATLPIIEGFESYTTGPDFTATEYFCNVGYGWTFSPDGNGRGRLQAGAGYYNNGLQAWTMDQQSFFSGGISNFMTMDINLSNYTTSGGITLSFHIMDHGNPAHPDNRVWVRGDVSDPWIEVVNIDILPGSNGQWDSIVGLDILAPIAAAGQSVGANTQIRWGQYGSSSSFSTSFSDGYTIDDVVIDAVSCPKPTGLSVANLLDTSATLNWNAVGSAGNYQVWFGPAGFYQGTTTTTGTQVFTSADSLHIDTLNEQLCYEFLVRGACSPGDTSEWEGPFVFCTPCSPISAPYFENWDGLTSGTKDLGCFTSIESPGFTSNFIGVSIQSSTFYNPFSSPNYVELDNSNNTTDPLILISPLTTDLTAGDKRVRLMARKPSSFYPSTLIVGTISDVSDASTFNPVDTLVLDATQFTEHIVEITTANGYNGTDNRFAIAHDLDDVFDFLLVDDIHYERIPTCIRPDSLAVDASTISDTSGTVSWVSNSGTGTNFQIEYGQGPVGDPSNTRVSVTGTSINLTGLTPGTGYCVWVREICTPGDTSFWRGPVCFATLCPLSGYTAPYFTNFEGISIGLASGTPAGWENCWTTSGSGPRWESEDASGANENSLNTGPWYDNTFYPTAGGTYMYLETSTGGGQADLVSPLINFSGLNNPELEYHYHMYGATINHLLVLAEDANGNTTVLDSIAGQQQTAGNDSFYVRNIPLTSLPSGNYNFIFRGVRGTSFTGDIAIDDVSVQEGATCPAPINLRQVGVAGLSTVDIAWNGGGATYEIEYGPVGFARGAGTTVTTTNNPYTITGLTAATNYDFYVREICSPGDTSTWAGPAQAATGICAPSSQCMFYFDLTDSFGDGWNGAEITIEQNGIAVGTMGSGFTTGNFFQDSILLCNGLQTDIILTNAGGWPSEIGVIVYDPNGLPVDSFTTASPVPGTNDTLISFTANCGFPCPDPTGVTVTSNVGCDSIEVDWMSASGGSIIEYGPTGFTPGTGTMTGIVTAPYTITGLSANTGYDIYVADTCTGDTSNYIQITANTANAPQPVAAIGITDTIIGSQFIVYADASGSSNATSYSWDFGNGVVSSNALDTVVYTGNGSYTITLIATNACGSDTATFMINVNVGLENNPLANSLNVYPNPATDKLNVSFREVGSADVNIRLRDAQGREVMNITERMSSGNFNRDINVSSLARGIYMLEVSSGDYSAHRRVSIK